MNHLNFVIICGFVLFCGAQLPSTITKCENDNEKCLLTSINSIFNKNFQGIPEIGLVSLDPMKIDTLSITYKGNETLNWDIDFSNVNLVGLSGAVFYKTTGFSKNQDKMKLDLRYKVPYLSVLGPYKIKTKIVTVDMEFSGQSNVTLVGLDIKMEMLTKMVEKNGKKHLQIGKIKVDFDANGFFNYYENIFNMDKTMADNFNKFLNDNWKDVLSILKPSIISSFSKVYMDVMNKVFQKVPYNDLFVN